MSIATIKAITKRVRLRYGNTEEVAKAAGVAPSTWSGWENADKEDTTIPLGKLISMSLTADERSAFAALFTEAAEVQARNVLTESMEATEAVARVMGTVRLAAADGELTETEKRRIRAEALEARAQLDDVIQGVG